ncbi:AMP-binding protein [Chelatococcus reniformis]|uniref:ATP-dependent acyl-CoA ligase n=1 Tax=Chelatococcus reniformis TaxID=1494448 RepID=A0A916UJC2_9HYPH|nr:AMP-binding protein [Chelatococcus reniformis]GGC74489.1 ATP-dependent acyl-CoA ligase [Chelatococcus reniformis]
MPLDPRVPPRDECVLRYLLDARADQMPDKPFVVFEDGAAWSYAELRQRVRTAARALQDLGVKQGDHVLVWLPNGPDCLKIWFAINYIGAVYVPLNTAYRGRVLEHVVALSDAALGIVHGDLMGRLADVDRARLADIVVLHDKGERLDGLRLHAASVLDQAIGDVTEPERPIEPWDAGCIIYTSGTTGPSKAVLSSYLHLYSSGDGFPLASADDRHMVTLPLFHAGGTIPIYLMLARGGSIALVESFSTERFWEVVQRTQTTTVILLGVMGGFLMKRPDPPAEQTRSLRWVTALPLDEDAIGFGRRFGVDVITVFNMTEVSCPLVSEVGPTLVGSCGRPRPGVEARVVDANDCEVAPGEVGELIVRTDRPWAMNHGYYKNPAATAEAWRNGWFHTGDGFRRDEAGNFFFVDRMKDAIRRRGENISSFEVEAEVCAHPAVREAAAVAVKSEVSEDEVLVAVSLAEGASLDPAELIDFLRPRMAHFMVPRFVRIIGDLPKTPTQKVQKHLIRTEGVTDETWDRDKAGIVIKRERLTSA